MHTPRMSRAARCFLLINAALCAGFIGLAGTGFAELAEPSRVDAWTYVFWALAALLVAAPLWIPALVPERHPAFFKLVRWLGAIALVLPILLFTKMFAEQTRMSGLASLFEPTFPMVLVLLSFCLTSWTLLLRPELMRLGARVRRRSRESA